MSTHKKARTSQEANSNKNSINNKNNNSISIHQNTFTAAEDYISDNYKIRYNSVSCDYEWNKGEYGEFVPLNENSLYRELKKAGHNIRLSDLITLIKSDFVAPYDPIKEYFNNLQSWDGQDHIGLLTSYIEKSDPEIFDRQFKKFLVRAVACALYDDMLNKQAFILIHREQNSGKSTFCRFLCPPKLKEYIAEDISTDKDSRILLAKNFLINLDELTVMSKKDINSLKALLSKTQINERLPYDRKNTILPRRCSFLGSTNQTEFLNDETGTVRWLCFEIKSIDWNYHRDVNIDKVWSQAYHLLKNTDFRYELTSDEIIENEKRNKNYHILSTERELIEKFFEPDLDKEKQNFKTATEVIQRLNSLTEREFSLKKVQIGKALKNLQYPEGRDSLTRYGYYLHERII
jgi:predicted P-loop ATPase